MLMDRPMTDAATRPWIRRHGRALLAVGALLAIALAWWRWPVPITAEPAAAPVPPASSEAKVEAPAVAVAANSPAPTGVSPGVPAAAPAAAALAALPPLPPADEPFAAQIEALAARAEAGDPVAACRLLIDGMRCASSSRNATFAKQLEGSLARASDGMSEHAVINAMAHAEHAAAGSAAFCAGVDDNALPDPDRYLAAALPRLDVRQRVLLAMTDEHGNITRLPRGRGAASFSTSSANLVPQFLADHDLAFLQAGVAAFDPLALEGMLLLHAPTMTLGAANRLRLHQPNPQRFAHHALLMQQLYGEDALGDSADYLLNRVIARMSPEAQAALRSAVALEAARWTRSGAPPSPETIDTLRGAGDLCNES